MSTQKVKVRPLQDKDLEAIVRWNNDDEVERFMDGPQPKTMEECKQWYAECLTSRNYRLFALENETGVLLGELELDHISWRRREAELRIRIGEKEYWGQGYGRAAVFALLKIAFGQLNLDQVYLRVYQFNIRAIRCYEKVGFRRQACLRRKGDSSWRSLILMSIQRERFCRIKENAS